MKKLVFGNFKMNYNYKETSDYLDKFIPLVAPCKNEIVLFFPYTNLMIAGQKATATNVKIGAQNVSSEASGAFTGEISAKMLKGLCGYVLVGHSERRQLFLEKNEVINQKIKKALECGLNVVLCIGETKQERVSKKTKSVLTKQIQEALKGLYENELKNIIIAYEPIWAIGTGETPTIKQLEETIKTIREIIKNEYTIVSSAKLKVLYGGSVNVNNANNYLTITGVDGLLVGGACLKPDNFAKICSIKV